MDNIIYKQKIDPKLKKLRRLKINKFELRKFGKIKKKFKDYNAVIILGGLVGDPITKKYKLLSESINKRGIAKLIDELNGLNLKKLIFISTCSNYGLSKTNIKLKETSKLNPQSRYAKAKIFIEKHLLNKKGKVDYAATILRFATAFGVSPRMRFDLTINDFVRQLFFKKKLYVYDKNTSRPYCHVKDFARLIDKVLRAKKEKVNFQIFNCGSNKNNFLKKKIILKLKKIFNFPEIVYLKGDKDKRNYIVDFSKIRKVLNFKTKYDVYYGIKEIIKDLKKGKFSDLNNFSDRLGNYKIY